jgi:hypothetical protein
VFEQFLFDAGIGTGSGTALLWMVVLVLITGFISSVASRFEFTDAATGASVV